MNLEHQAPHSSSNEPTPLRFRRPVPQPVELPLRLRLVSGYLNFMGGVGLMVGAGTLLFKIFGEAGTQSASRIVSLLLVSASSMFASRALKRREKQGARIAIGLFVAPYLYMLAGRSDGGRVGLLGIFAIMAILSTWKELE